MADNPFIDRLACVARHPSMLQGKRADLSLFGSAAGQIRRHQQTSDLVVEQGGAIWRTAVSAQSWHRCEASGRVARHARILKLPRVRVGSSSGFSAGNWQPSDSICLMSLQAAQLDGQVIELCGQARSHVQARSYP